MTMPTWEEFMRPTLEVLADGVLRTRRELGLLVVQKLGLPPELTLQTIASGQTLYENRIGWGLSFLTNVGAMTRPVRGSYSITEAGKALLRDFPQGFSEKDVRLLGDDPQSGIKVYEATTSRKVEGSTTAVVEHSALTPTEQVQSGISRINEEIASELITRLQDREPAFFEQAVVDLLLAMGYGGTKDSGAVTQLSNDGGIDGVIDQDVLGLSKVYIQAKRYATDNTVGRPEIQAFVGALSGKADSGVFITTSRFSSGASEYAEGVPTRIILIDGMKLAELMIRFHVGVQVKNTFDIVEVDEDFFS